MCMNTCGLNVQQHFVDFENPEVSINPTYPVSLRLRLPVAESTVTHTRDQGRIKIF